MFNPFKRKVRGHIFKGFGNVRSFAAAEMSRILQPWTFDKGFDNQEIESQQRTIVSRSREMYKNSAHMKRFVSLCESNVVGDGFKLKSTPYDGQVGTPQYKLDTGAARFFEYHFWTWANNQKWCDATGRKTLVEIDRMCVKNWARDGEYFIIIYRGQNNPYGISLRVIRPDACDIRYRANISNGNTVRGGVELDANTMAPVAYYVQTTKEFSSVTTSLGHMRRIPAFNPELDQAESMIHGYTQEEEDQTRGIPLSHAILKKLKMLDELDIAELVAAKDEACTTHTYEAPVGHNVEELIDLTKAENGTIANSYMTEKEPGMSEIIVPGWTRKTNTPQHPNMQLVPFKATMLKDVASGINVEYANFANDWAGVSYSSVRQGTLSERDMWMTLQDRYISQCKSPVFLAFMRSLLAQEISGGFMITKFFKFREHAFRGKRWGWVDPMRDMRANELARLHGWKSDSQIAEDLGGDFGDTVEEIKRDDQLIKGTSLEVKADEQKAIV